MFKPLLRTLPSLSGNFTIACKLKEYIKDGNDDYSTYARLANINPLQNFLFKTDIELNLLNGKYEYDILKYYYYYSNFFYKENFQYDKKNYAMLNLNSLYNNDNDSRNKNYEFGCKRIQYSQTGYQFNFYAPFYLDDVNDLPEYFCIHIVLNDTIEKRIKVYINKDDKRNYLKNYLSKYFKQINDKVIFCLPESSQATYFGIDVKKGGLVQYKDNVFGGLYINQTTINNFDWTICQGFERNNLIMRQIFPLSFSFNLSDIFNKYDKKFFDGAKLKIYGFYYTKNNAKHDLYDFDINYTHAYYKYNKYNENTGKYEFVNGKDNNDKNINIMNVGFPALNESKYIKYAYTNKITPKYCKFKMLYSSDDDPYITNVNFAYSFLQYPNQKYGYFPTMFKGIYPKAIIKDNDLKLPIGTNLDTYYRISKYIGNKTTINTTNVDKYIKLMSNYYSYWYTLKEYNDDNLINNLCSDDSNWSEVKYDYSYYHGILYNLKFLKEYEIDKFGVFLDIQMNYMTQTELENNLVKAKYILSKSEESVNIINQYNDSYDMKFVDSKTNISYYNKIFNISSTNNNYNKSNVYLFENQNMVKDIKGKYVEEKNYIEENIFYKLSDLFGKFKEYVNNDEIFERFKNIQTYGYLLLDGLNNINYFEEYEYNNETHKRFILSEAFKSSEYFTEYSWIEPLLYCSTASNKSKILVSSIYENIDYNEDVFESIAMFLQTAFVHKNDIANILLEYNKLNVFEYLNQLESYIYIPIGTVNGIEIDNYFIKNENTVSLDIYVDTYNLVNYIKQYNKKYKKNISTNIGKTGYQYVKLLNKDHIKEYINRLNNDEYGNTTFGFTTDLIKIDNIETQIKMNSTILDNLYIKERCWNIDENVIKTIDRYLSLYDYLKRYDRNLITTIHYSYDNSEIINWVLNNISDSRSNNDNFAFNFNGKIIDLNLCFKKQMTILNSNLKQILQSNNFLYLYIKDSQSLNNNNTWPKISNNDLLNTSIEYTCHEYEYKNINEYLIPLFNDPYLNDNDCDAIANMLEKNKINKNNKYVLSTNKYFKEIDLDKELLNICVNDENFIKNWMSYIKKYLTISLTEFESKWDNYCYENKIYFNELTETDEVNASLVSSLKNYQNIIDDIVDTVMHKYSDKEWKFKALRYLFDNTVLTSHYRKAILYILSRTNEINPYAGYIELGDAAEFERSIELFLKKYSYDYTTPNILNKSIVKTLDQVSCNTINYYENLQYNEKKKYVSYILEFIKNYKDTNLYYYLAKYKGIILYSIKKSSGIEFNKLNSINNNNLIYDDYYKIYIYKDEITHHNYAFYWISLSIDNTNNTFNILDDYGLNMSFSSINGNLLLSNTFDKYFNKTFYLIEPFLNFNIFNEVTKKINSIIYPNESEINIKYVSTLLNDEEHIKYSMLKDSDDDFLYNEIVKLPSPKKIKLLRYFNYITPYIKKTYIIEDNWKLKFMNSENTYKSIKKYNILEKENLNIYKYDKIGLYDGVFDNKEYSFNTNSLINQYEYKHFNDNLLYNLPEEITVKDSKEYNEEFINNLKENEDEIKNQKIKILLKYFHKKGLDYDDIILFLFNKYDSNMIIDRIDTYSNISKKIYNISYKFNLL